ETESVRNAETRCYLPRDRDHAWPIHRRHADVRGLRESDAPHVGSGGQIEHGQGRSGFRHLQRFAQPLCSGVVYREDAFNKLPEEWNAVLLSIDMFLRSPTADNVVELCPFRQHWLAR